jgi:hypothetical protein
MIDPHPESLENYRSQTNSAILMKKQMPLANTGGTERRLKCSAPVPVRHGGGALLLPKLSSWRAI